MIYAGIDIGGTAVKLGLVSKNGGLICRTSLPVHSLRTYEGFLDAITQELLQMRDRCAADGLLAGAGAGSPGNIDARSGRVVWIEGKLEFLDQQWLARDLEGRLGVPVFCDNDVNTILLGEQQFGAAGNYSSVIGLTLGTGIGGAIIYNGILVHGAHHASANFGYMSARPSGRPHVCGNSGAVENYASHAGLIERIRQSLARNEKTILGDMMKQEGPAFGFRHIYEAAQSGDTLSGRLIAELVDELAVLIANLIFAFDPEALLIGGGMMNAGGDLFDRIASSAKRRIVTFPADSIRILPMTLGDDGGIFGGAAMAMAMQKT